MVPSWCVVLMGQVRSAPCQAVHGSRRWGWTMFRLFSSRRALCCFDVSDAGSLQGCLTNCKLKVNHISPEQCLTVFHVDHGQCMPVLSATEALQMLSHETGRKNRLLKQVLNHVETLSMGCDSIARTVAIDTRSQAP